MDGRLRLAKSSRDRPSERPVRQGAGARRPAGTRVVIVTLDLVGIGPDVADPIRAELASKYDLAAANVAFCCSHTHSGPVVGHNLRTLHYDLVDETQQKLIDEYAKKLHADVVLGRRPGDRGARAQPDRLGSRHGDLRRQPPQQQGTRGAEAAGRGQARRPVRPRRAGAQDHGRLGQAHRRAVWLCLPRHGADVTTTGRATTRALPKVRSKHRIPVALRFSLPAAAPIKTPCPAARSNWPNNMAGTWPPRSTWCWRNH